MVRGKDKSGLCSNCLELVRFAEANSEYGPDGEKLDFEDRDTFKCRFKESWEIIKENEGLTLDDVYSPNDIEFHNSILGKRKKQEEEAEFIGWGSKPLLQFLNFRDYVLSPKVKIINRKT